eukprot:CAMPEP_0197525502 /NCGR_PEP_ID=MMETSP1318-20131121/12840_1 /TAXON_ID=552666 /ORGANISM="Partenskyella glossopodia, Strain RCC365" /LENGTH=435 /DNA_ID=CAMNT_0043079011 /DNA_START=95 /DNA_END=1403 /DNA_ORIENTATION=-
MQATQREDEQLFEAKEGSAVVRAFGRLVFILCWFGYCCVGGDCLVTAKIQHRQVTAKIQHQHSTGYNLQADQQVGRQVQPELQQLTRTGSHHMHRNRSSLTFLAIGDWGPEDTDGECTSDSVQAMISQGMAKLIAKGEPASSGSNVQQQQQQHADFVLLLGDNFYPRGIEGDEFSERFQSTFEKRFASDDFDCPFYAILGNHDYLGNTTAQIQYTQHSTRWKMPHRWHKVSKSFGSGRNLRRVDIFLVDTIIMAGMSSQIEGRFLPGPESKQLAKSQLDWLEHSMAHSKAHYKFVAGHYPIYSIGPHGPSPLVGSTLLPLLKKYNAHYLCGHDHDVQVLQDKDGIVHVVSGIGGGDKCCYKGSMNSVPAEWVKFAATGREGEFITVNGEVKGDESGSSGGLKGGFASIRVGLEDFSVVVHGEDGRELYSIKVDRK